MLTYVVILIARKKKKNKTCRSRCSREETLTERIVLIPELNIVIEGNAAIKANNILLLN